MTPENSVDHSGTHWLPSEGMGPHQEITATELYVFGELEKALDIESKIHCTASIPV